MMPGREQVLSFWLTRLQHSQTAEPCDPAEKSERCPSGENVDSANKMRPSPGGFEQRRLKRR